MGLGKDAMVARNQKIREVLTKFRAEVGKLESASLWDLRNSLTTESWKLYDAIYIINNKLGIIKSEAKRRDQPGPTVDVSEHAVLRYLERVNGVDTRSIRKKIRAAIPPDAKRGDKFTVEGMVYVISENGRVITTYQDNEPCPSPTSA